MFNLTKEERQVILFLFAIALTGIGVRFFLKTHCAAKVAACFEERVYKVNLNKADKFTLMNIPGIGEKLSGRILEYRKENGDFSGFDELKKIKGMNEHRLEKLKDWVYLD